MRGKGEDRIEQVATDGREPVLYPAFLDLAGRKVVVVGAGKVAWRKVERLLAAGAQVLVIGARGCRQVDEVPKTGKLFWRHRGYIEGDLEGACLCICATDDRELNRKVSEDAEKLGIFVNVVDDPELCTATLPAVMQRGKLQIAVSTAGAAPALSRNIRKDLELRYDERWEAYLEVLAQARRLVKQRVSGGADVRKPLFEALIDGRLEKRIVSGEDVSAEQAYAEYVAPIAGEVHGR